MKVKSILPLYMLPTLKESMTLFQNAYLDSGKVQPIKMQPIETLPSILLEPKLIVGSFYANQIQALCKLGSFVCISLALGWSIQAIIKQYNRRQS